MASPERTRTRTYCDPYDPRQQQIIADLQAILQCIGEVKLWKTYHALNTVLDTVGWEIAEQRGKKRSAGRAAPTLRR